jgi:hypothetical protein
MKRRSWRSFPKPDEAVILVRGGEAVPVGRPDFKPGWGRQAVLGRFDSCSLPPVLACQVAPDGLCGFHATCGEIERHTSRQWMRDWLM